MEQIFCLNGHREKNSAAGVWWLGSFAGAFHVFGFQELSREVPWGKMGRSGTWRFFFFRWRCFFVEMKWMTSTGNSPLEMFCYDLRNMLSSQHEGTLIYDVRIIFQLKRFKDQTFFPSKFCWNRLKNQISAFFFWRLEKRSGCFCWLRFFFGRSGFDAWLAQNGGGSNAYTAEEQTVFYASVSGKAVSFWLGASKMDDWIGSFFGDWFV